MDIEKLYQQKLIVSEQIADFLANDQNLILGMGVAMPPELIRGVSTALYSDQLKRLNLYYMHGSEVLSQTLL